MGSSILSEVDDTSILRTGLSTCYWRPLGRLLASRLRPPRSGLERSDFVLWPFAADVASYLFGSYRSNSGHAGRTDAHSKGANDPTETLWAPDFKWWRRRSASIPALRFQCAEQKGVEFRQNIHSRVCIPS
jgi:hypothetical protein